LIVGPWRGFARGGFAHFERISYYFVMLRPPFLRFQRSGLWRNADFLRLWSGQTISVFGSMIGGTALSFTATLFLQATPFQMSLLHAKQILPAFLLGLFAGAWVDRLRRRPLLIGADIGRALVLATIPLAALVGILGIEQLFLVALLVSVLSILFDLSYQAYLPALVGKEHVLEGNSKLTASASVAEFAGFGIGGWLVQLLSGPLAILVDAISFLVSAWTVGTIRTHEEDVVHDGQPDMRAEIRTGIGEVLRQPFLRSAGATALIERFSGGIFGALVVLYMSRDLGFAPAILTMTWAVGGVSSLIGAALAPRAARRFGAPGAMIFGLGLSALFSLCLPLAWGATPLSLLLLVLLQFGDGFNVIYDITLVSTRQRITPERLLGRVTGTMQVLGLGASLTGTLAGGFLGELLGVRATLFLAAGIGIAAAVVLAVMLAWIRTGLEN
jgi:MFS family permease